MKALKKPIKIMCLKIPREAIPKLKKVNLSIHDGLQGLSLYLFKNLPKMTHLLKNILMVN